MVSPSPVKPPAADDKPQARSLSWIFFKFSKKQRSEFSFFSFCPAISVLDFPCEVDSQPPMVTPSLQHAMRTKQGKSLKRGRKPRKTGKKNKKDSKSKKHSKTSFHQPLFEDVLSLGLWSPHQTSLSRSSLSSLRHIVHDLHAPFVGDLESSHGRCRFRL